MPLAPAPHDREAEAAGRLQIPRAPTFQLGDGMFGEKLFGDGWLHVGGLRLHRFLADLREATVLVAHATRLAAHPERAGLTGVRLAQPPDECQQPAGLAGLLERIADGAQAAAGVGSFHGVVSVPPLDCLLEYQVAGELEIYSPAAAVSRGV